MAVVGIIIGFVAALALAYYLTSVFVKRSNDAGDSKGNFEDFSKHDIFVMAMNDKCKRGQIESLIDENILKGVNKKRWICHAYDQSDISGDYIR